MTVKELKEILSGIPDEYDVFFKSDVGESRYFTDIDFIGSTGIHLNIDHKMLVIY